MEEIFQGYYALLFSVAYRLLGSASDAEDIVQECYIRYVQAAPQEIRSLKSYLVTSVTRLCLDQLKSARTQREHYIGPWLPEPLLTENAENLALHTLEQQETIELAFLHLLERLTPYERAIFLLHEVFAYSHEEIAEIVDKNAVYCRRLLHQAKEHLGEEQVRFAPSKETQKRLVHRFIAACQQGEVQALVDLLAQDVVKWADGGGKISVARIPLYGRDRVLRLLSGLMRKFYPRLRFIPAEVNGAMGILIWEGEQLVSVMSFEMTEEHIYAIREVLNPDKLTYMMRQLQASLEIPR